MDFRLLHISDIHLGPHVRCGRDLYEAAHRLSEEIASDLETFKFPPVQAVVASGDLTQGAGKDEFEAALRFFNSLSEKISVPLSNFVFVPGNHDIAWYAPSVLNQAPVPNLREDALNGYESFYKQIRGVKKVPVCYAEFLFFERESPPVVIVGFNSARFEDSRTAGLGFVGEGQMFEIFAKLRKEGVDNSWLKIAALHHHLVPILNVDVRELLKPREARKITMMVDAAGVLNLLIADGFSLVLHGHMHNAFCAVERRETLPTNFPRVAGGEIVIHGAGTLGMSTHEGDTESHYSVVSVREGGIDIRSVIRPIGGKDASASQT